VSAAHRSAITNYLIIPFILFQIDLSFPGFFLGAGFGIGFGASVGDGEGDGEAVGLGDAEVLAFAEPAPLAESVPRHQRAASTPEPRIAITSTIPTAASRNLFLLRAEICF
jgi:hypothetical protein